MRKRVNTGELDEDEFLSMVKDLLLDLSAEQVARMHEKMDEDGDGSIAWNEFVLAAPAMLRVLYEESGAQASEADWCELPAERGQTFWYNKRSGAAQVKKPRQLVESEKKAGPNVKVCVVREGVCSARRCV